MTGALSGIDESSPLAACLRGRVCSPARTCTALRTLLAGKRERERHTNTRVHARAPPHTHMYTHPHAPVHTRTTTYARFTDPNSCRSASLSSFRIWSVRPRTFCASASSGGLKPRPSACEGVCVRVDGLLYPIILHTTQATDCPAHEPGSPQWTPPAPVTHVTRSRSSELQLSRFGEKQINFNIRVHKSQCK